MSTEDKLSAKELYHSIWALVSKVFWYQERLTDWHAWEHNFDDELHTDADAFRCASLMVGSLNEAYTHVLAPTPVSDNDGDETETSKVCCFAQMLPGQIGYIKIITFDSAEAAIQIRDAMESIQDAVAFVVDLRNNGGGLVGRANKALSVVMDEGGTYILKERRPADGYFEAYCRIEANQFAERVEYMDKGTSTDDTWTRYENLTGSKPMVVLINRGTASASEFFAAVLRDGGRAKLIGTKTGGKGIAQNTIAVGNGYKLQITDGVFLPPSGQWFGDHNQTVYNGIIPDVEVALDDEGDSQMAAALAYLATT